MCLSSHTLFLLNTLLVSLRSISMWKFTSTELRGQGLVTDHWLKWLGFSILTAVA